MRLITIRFSHFCEKARWGLDVCGVPYEEDGHLPGFHVKALKAARARGEKDAASSPYSTPTLITDDKTALTDSTAILAFASERWTGGTLYPDGSAADGATVSALEARFHDGIGIHSRRLAYSFLLNDLARFRKLCWSNVPGFESIAASVGAPFIRKRFLDYMGIDDNTQAKATAVVDAVMDEVSTLIDGREFLVGDSLSAADISFAAGAAPALVIHASEGYGAELPSLDELPPDYRRLAERWRKTPAGQFALRLFQHHRGQRIVPFGTAV